MTLMIIFLLTAAGMISIAGGIKYKLKQKSVIRDWKESSAKVIEVLEEESSSFNGASRAFYPVLEYRGSDNAVIRKRSETGYNPPRWSAGDSVKIFLNPTNGEEFIIGGDITNRHVSFALIFIGLDLIIIAAVLFFINW